MADPTVGVVIRCLNEEEHIGRLLTGLERQTRRPDQVVVVDSGSTDATVDIASRYTADVLDIEPADFSFGRALNIGCAHADTDILVLVSAHVYPLYDTWLAQLVAPFADRKVALSYGRQVGDQRTKYSESRVLLKWFPASSIPRQTYPFCNNANAAVRRSLWRELPYDEDLTGLEDLDWAKRALARGFHLSYVAEAPVVHVHEESWGRIANRYRREAIAYGRIMGRQGIGPLESLGLAVTNTLSDFVHAGRDRVLLQNLAGIPAFRAAQFWGAYRGFLDDDRVSDQLKHRFYYPLEVGSARPVEAPGKPIDYAAHEPPSEVRRRA
ncbi:MAG: glycosyltransferase family 2 protein [Propionicimonas sp.]